MVRKRGLGRGLEALLEREPETALPVGRLEPSHLQPRSRFDEEDLESLAASIKSQGIVQPIVVTPSKKGIYRIVAGERRWRAAQLAGLDTVPVAVRDVADERQLLELALVENLQRADLNPIEEAEAYRSLEERFGLSHAEIGNRVGKSRATVANMMRLLRLEPPVLELLRSGRLTAGQARPLLAVDDPGRQIALARRAAAEGLSARTMESLASAKPAGKKKERQVDVHTRAAEVQLTRELKTKVEIHRRGRGGTLRIAFHSEEELIRLHELLMDRGGSA